MLTGTQVATGGYITEDGTLLCEECFDQGDDYAKPLSNYALDEWQSAEAEGYEWSYEDLGDWSQDMPEDVPELVDLNDIVDAERFHEECEPALYDEAGHELREAYHYHRERPFAEVKLDA